jgi:Berberine and berberine like
MTPYEAGRYLGFCEQPTDFEAAFPAETRERLRAVRAKHDPDGVFRANHPLG